MGVNEAARTYNVPATTLRRRKSKNNMTKERLGPSSTLGKEAEDKLVIHILKLQKTGFTPTEFAQNHRQYPIIISGKTGEVQDDQQPCCSWQNRATPSPEKYSKPTESKTKESPKKLPTPGKILDVISVVSTPVDSVRRRSKQLAEILTDKETIKYQKEKWRYQKNKGNQNQQKNRNG